MKKQDTKTILKNYDGDFLECRDLRHAFSVVGYYRQGGEIRRSLSCIRCPMQATDRWKPNATRINRTYNAPTGYRIKGGVPTIQVRQEVLRRATVFNTEDEMIQSLFGDVVKVA